MHHVSNEKCVYVYIAIYENSQNPCIHFRMKSVLSIGRRGRFKSPVNESLV